MIKVTGGELKGRYIKSIDGDVTRPTASKVREAIFSILSTDIYESNFLDLFAGTGLIGIEAFSRGSTKVVSIERDINSFKTLKKNIIDLKIEDNFEIYKTDAEIYLKKSKESFDIIYIDPPYKSNSYEKVFRILESNTELIKEDGKVIVEYATKIQLPSFGFHLLKSYKYGDTSLNIYNKLKLE